MKKLNNKGYMLVEIIMAFAITFALLYFMMDIVIKMKNKNDDLLVDSIVKVDSTIVTNKLMEYAISDVKDNDTADAFCDNIIIEGRTIKYGDNVVDILDDTASVIIDENVDFCNVNKDTGKVSVRIPVKVKQMEDKNFDIIMDYNYIIIKDVDVPIVSSYWCANISFGSAPWILHYTGDCEVIDDLDGNWRVKFLTSGDLTLLRDFIVDAFLVGGGGGGGNSYEYTGYGGGGGGGGYRDTKSYISLSKNTPYPINIGVGGTKEHAGGSTTAFNYEVSGGNGGSGQSAGSGGASGGRGGIGTNCKNGFAGGYEFDDVSYGTQYGGGGGAGGSCVCGGCNDCECFAGKNGGRGGGGKGGGSEEGGGNSNGKDGVINSGGGGGGAGASYGSTCESDVEKGGSGGAGVVIIRNTRNELYTIEYNANGGTGAPESQIKISNSDITLSSAIPSRDGYYFLGWSTSVDATTPTYETGGIYSTNGDATLYAVWQIKGPMYDHKCANEIVGINYGFVYTGDCEVIDDGNKNWRVKFKTSGQLTFSNDFDIDAFLVGGGGGGGGVDGGGGGGGGGYTHTEKNIKVVIGTVYDIIIGVGGAARHESSGLRGGSGQSTSAFNISVAGGLGGFGRHVGYYKSGGAGGSGGGAGGYGSNGGNGGSYGSNGRGTDNGSGGRGQTTTTCEFGEGTLNGCDNGVEYAYAGGGGGGYSSSNGGRACGIGGVGGGGSCAVNGKANTGGGGGGNKGASNGRYSGAGGSGIVVIRNVRQ